jgi:uncharacterized protein (TIGR02246 family)
MASDPRAQILEDFVAAYLAAWGRHDAAALATFYASDADLSNFRGKPLHGTEAIQAFFARAFRQNLAEVKLAAGEHRIRFVSEGVATMDLSATISGEKDAKGGSKPPRLLRCDGTLVQNPRGGWWMVVGHLRLQNLDPPASKPGAGPTTAATPPADAATADPDG